MKDDFPFLYYDVQARIIPGGIALAVLSLVGLDVPPTWMHWWVWLYQGGSAQAVILPAVYVAGAYCVGLLLDVGLSGLMQRFYIRGFGRALGKYIWSPPPAKPKPPKHSATLDLLSKKAFDVYRVQSTKVAGEEQKHVLRFHSEAKMFCHLGAVFVATSLLAGTARLIAWNVFAELHSYWRLAPLAISGIVCLRASWTRAERRAKEILPFFDHFGKGNTEIDGIVPELQELQAILQAQAKWWHRLFKPTRHESVKLQDTGSM